MLFTTIVIAVLSVSTILLGAETIRDKKMISKMKELVGMYKLTVNQAVSNKNTVESALVNLVASIPVSTIKAVNKKLNKSELNLIRSKNEDGKTITVIESIVEDTIDIEDKEGNDIEA